MSRVVLPAALVFAGLTAATGGAAGAATFTVDDTGDSLAVDNLCTLREAIFAANGASLADCPPAASAGNRIEFAIPGPGPHVITPGAVYPALSVATTIDGLSQPGVVAATACTSGPLAIVIDGSLVGAATPNSAGLSIGLPAGGGSVIRGLVMRDFVQAVPGFLVAIMINNTDGNTIECNFLGTDETGTSAAPNQMSIRLAGGSDNLIRENLIGLGNAPTSIRGISVDTGAFAATEDNVIRDNRIGTNLAGTGALGGNAGGIELLNNTLRMVIEGNLVSGAGSGISVSAAGTRIRGNKIGTNAAGTNALGNGFGIIVNVGSSDTIVGTDGDGANDTAERNLISGNSNTGVLISSAGADTRVSGNYIGVQIGGNAALGNASAGVFIVGNGGVVVGTNGDGVGDAVEGNVIGGSGSFGVLASGKGNRISGNHIGVGADGLSAVPNLQGVRLSCLPDATGDLVGTDGDGVSDDLERNVISGNVGAVAAAGIRIEGATCHDNRVAGNYIGVDKTGTVAVPNSVGVWIDGGAYDNVVGTNADGNGDEAERNVIAGNTGEGVKIDKNNSADVFGNRVAGNWIGLGSTGNLARPNGGGGVTISGGRDNVVGSDSGDPIETNIIVAHPTVGVSVHGSTATGNLIAFNYFGTDATTSVVFPNATAIRLTGLSQTVVSDNVVFGSSTRGVEVSTDAFFALSPAAPSIDNCVVQNAEGARKNPAGAPFPVFENNWWGAIAGPNTAGADTAFDLDTTPFLTTAPAGCPTVFGTTAVKAFSSAEVPLDGTTVLTVTLANASDTDTATSVSFTDTLPNPSALELASAPSASGCGSPTLSGTVGGVTFGLSGGTILPLSTCTVQVTVKGIGVGSHDNTITDFRSTLGSAAETVQSSNTATLNVAGVLTISKSNGVSTVAPGGTTVYTIVVSNPAGAPVVGATVADPFPVELDCSWTCAGAGGGDCSTSGLGDINDTVDLPTGASVTYTATCSVDEAATGSLVNTATVTAPDATSAQATDTDTLAPEADVSVTKTDGVLTATPGESVTYAITISNAGPSAAPAATLSDTFPAFCTSVSYTSVAAGGATGNTASDTGHLAETLSLPASASVTYTATCTISPVATGTLDNTATVSAGSGVTDPDTDNDEAIDSDTLAPEADVSVTKTDGVLTATPGESVTYAITISNAGPSAAPAATLTDAFPAFCTGVSYTSVAAGGATGNTASDTGNLSETLNLPVNASVTYTATCTISPSATGTLDNTATVAAGAGVTDPDSDNDEAIDSDTLTVEADVSVTKTDGVLTATPGESVTYTITISNAGPSAAPAATLSDPFPAFCTSVSYTSVAAGGATGNTASDTGNLSETLNLPVNASVTYTATCTISPSATGTLDNTATVSAGSGVTDPDSDNDEAIDSDTLLVEADVSVTKTDGVLTATPGESVTYTITISNAGPSTAPAATLTDAFPAFCTSVSYTSVPAGGATGNTASDTGNLAETLNLPVNASVTYTATCTISPSATGTLDNTATVSAGSGVTDPDTDNDEVIDSDTLAPEADVSVTKTDGVLTATPGEAVTYAITISNAGPSAAPAATLTDAFPAFCTGVSYTSVAAGGATGNTASDTGNLSETLNLPVNASVTYTATCTIAPSATGTLDNTATVSAGSGVTDPDTDNDEAIDSDTLAPEADLSITKTDGVTLATPGGSVVYTITVRNDGPSAAPGSQVVDSFPAACTGVTFTSVASGGATGNTASDSGDIADSLALPPDSSVTYTATCTLSGSASGSLVNTATVSANAGAGVGDPNPDNNEATDSDGLSEADLQLTKTDGVATAVPGTSITYTITVSNAGPTAVTAATVTDTLPAACDSPTFTSVASGGATGNTAAGAGNVSEMVNLPVGSSITYTVQCSLVATATVAVENTATVTPPAEVSDPSPENATAMDSTALTPRAALSISKVAAGVAQPGGTVTYTITVTNAGPSASPAATVEDAFDANLTCSWTCGGTGGGTCTGSGSGDIADTVDLPVGGQVVYSATCDIGPGFSGTLSNTATVTAADGVTDPNPQDNEATVESASQNVVEIPTLSAPALGLLAALVGWLALGRLRRRRA